jgi:hypothetical protein
MKWTRSSSGSSISVRSEHHPVPYVNRPRAATVYKKSVKKDTTMFENQKAGIKELTERLKGLRGYL